MKLEQVVEEQVWDKIRNVVKRQNDSIGNTFRLRGEIAQHLNEQRNAESSGCDSPSEECESLINAEVDKVSNHH